MARWLESDYGLSSGEAALVLGTVARFRIPDVVGPWVSVAPEVNQARLVRLEKVAVVHYQQFGKFQRCGTI